MRASADKLVRDVWVVVQDAEDLIKATSGDVEEKTREARAKLAGALVVAKETLQQADDADDQAVRGAGQLIRGHPYPSLGFAFFVGILFGVIVTRRCYYPNSASV